MINVLEIIELRSVIKNRHEVVSLIKSLLEDELNRTGVNIKIYTHATFVTDYCISIKYEVKENQEIESKLGHQLNSYLREYGLVNHNTWIENNNKGNGNEK